MKTSNVGRDATRANSHFVSLTSSLEQAYQSFDIVFQDERKMNTDWRGNSFTFKNVEAHVALTICWNANCCAGVQAWLWRGKKISELTTQRNLDFQNPGFCQTECHDKCKSLSTILVMTVRKEMLWCVGVVWSVLQDRLGFCRGCDVIEY